MKKLLLILSVCTAQYIFAQTPGVNFLKPVKSGTDAEAIYDIKRAHDNGFIAVGADSIFNYFKPTIHLKGHADLPYIWKIDNNGNVTWKTTINNFNSAFVSVALSPDGGYVAAGYAAESFPWDTAKLYIAKFNATGGVVWEKKYSGSMPDYAFSIAATSSGGYIVAGCTASDDGDVTGHHGTAASYDIWMMKLDGSGNIIWKKCFGGSGDEIAYSVIQLSDKGFVVAGTSSSNDGDLNANNGGFDAWIYRTDSMGVLQWQKNIGGNADEAFTQLAANADGSFTASGYTLSSSVLSNGNKGLNDVWVARIANGGNVIWSKGFGGTQQDYGMSIAATQDNSFIVTGITESNNGDVTGHNGLADAWMLKISDAGNMVWQKTVGTARDEFGMSGIYLGENDFIMGGIMQPVTPPADLLDAFVARLGNYTLLRVNLVSPYAISQGTINATKATAQYSTTPVNNSANMFIDTGQYTVSFTYPNGYFTSSPPSLNVSLPAFFDTTIIQFTITPVPQQRDLNVSGFPLTPARPGFPVSYKIFYANAGTDTVASGQLLFKKDSRMSFVNAVPPVSTIIGDTLKWNYTNLKPFDTASVTVNMLVAAPPTVNLNDTLTSMGIITPVAGDLTPADDTVIIRQRVIGSYDPNDKTENLSGRISPQQVASGAFINYIIRFQNTGTDTAFNIVIRDSLDAKLDWNSFRMVAASHPYQLNITSQNRIAWDFNNIRLVDSNRNERASHGFIAYRIKPKSNLLLGDIIRNSASIYFDYNLPVRTNIQQTVVMADVITGVGNPQVDPYSMTIFPNPTGEKLWVRINERSQGEAMLKLFDLTGREVMTRRFGQVNMTNFSTSIDLKHISPGYYTVVMSVGQKIYTQKLILQ
jgi:uncharacterized repeat protein (TIGR01451 family)